MAIMGMCPKCGGETINYCCSYCDSQAIERISRDRDKLLSAVKLVVANYDNPQYNLSTVVDQLREIIKEVEANGTHD